MDSNYEGRRKIMAVLMNLVRKAKQTMEEFAAEVEDDMEAVLAVMKAKAKMYGPNRDPEMWAKVTAGIKKIASEQMPKVKSLLAASDTPELCDDSATNINNILAYLQDKVIKKLDAINGKAMKMEKFIGEVTAELKGPNMNKIPASEALKRYNAEKASLQKKLKDLDNKIKDAEKAGEDLVTLASDASVNFDKIEETVVEMYGGYVKPGETPEKPAPEDKAPAKSPAKAPEKAPAKTPAKQPGIGDINQKIKDKTKDKTKTSLNGVPVVAAGEAGLNSMVKKFTAATELMMSEIEGLEAPLDEMDASMDELDATLQGMAEAVSEAMESAEGTDEVMNTDEAPAEDPAGDVPTEILPTPATHPELVTTQSIETPWLKQSELEVTADVKHFPSEFDQSGGHLDLIESDNGQKLVVKKDLKSKVEQKIKEAMAGKYQQGETVAVDLGDRIVPAVITQYASEGVYEVISEGRTLRVPDANVFKNAEQIWR